MNVTEFHFLRPDWFWATLPFVLVMWLSIRQRLNRRNWESVCDNRLLPYILEDTPGKNARWPIAVFGLAGLMCIVAMAGPTWERLPSPVFRSDSAVVILLDLSRSMDAADIKPSRLQRARYKISDILNQRKDGQTALVVYAADAFTVAPLTDDVETIMNQLSSLSTSMMPAQGSHEVSALKRAENLLKQAGLTRGSILVVSDAVDSESYSVAAQLNQQGFNVSVLGVGTADGAPIPNQSGGFLKDRSGSIVVPKLTEAKLAALAREGGGIYRTLSADGSDVDALVEEFDVRPDVDKVVGSDMHVDLWNEMGPWLLLLVLPLAAMAFRRGYLLIVALWIVPVPDSAYALEWNEVWLNKDQQGYAALQNGDAEKAAELFQNPDWKAAAEYDAKQYDKVLESLASKDDGLSHYNRGNALSRLGRFSEALEAYSSALEQNPKDEDAQFNKELIEKFLEQQEQNKQNQSQDSSNDDSEQGQKDEQKSGDKQSGDQKDSQRSGEDPVDSNEDKAAEQKDQGQESAAQSVGKDETREGKDKEQQANQQVSEQNDAEQQSVASESNSDKEAQQANEQWLRRIPDDPGRLLRRKFKYQYNQRGGRNAANTGGW